MLAIFYKKKLDYAVYITHVPLVLVSFFSQVPNLQELLKPINKLDQGL